MPMGFVTPPASCISPTGDQRIKKESELQPVNHVLLAILNPEQIEVEIWRVDELEVHRGLSSELDEMWSFVARKTHPRWLWHAIDHHTGKGVGLCVWTTQGHRLCEAQSVVRAVWHHAITRMAQGVPIRQHLDAEKRTVGRTKLHRKSRASTSIYGHESSDWYAAQSVFTKTKQMHDLVIALFINPARVWASSLTRNQQI